ncbi:hypothetical protein ACHAPG_011361, partial [Botrytis cinerea]
MLVLNADQNIQNAVATLSIYDRLIKVDVAHINPNNAANGTNWDEKVYVVINAENVIITEEPAVEIIVLTPTNL